MKHLFWLSAAQLKKIEPYFPASHGVPRVDDARVISGLIHVLRNGLQWQDTSREYGPYKTLYNCFIRWSRMGIFNQIFSALASKHRGTKRLMIDAIHLKAHRVAASLLKKGCFPLYWPHQRQFKLETACDLQ